MTEPLHDLSAHALLAGYRARHFSPVDVLDSVLHHVERWEPHIAASWLLRPDAVRAQARASEARWRRGEPCGALDGVPVTIKDNIATAGDPVPLGTRAVPLLPATADAPPAARLREAGAILLCKTTMPDYGMLSSGLSTFHRLSRNPWDLALTPGGSSAGAGAAAAPRLDVREEQARERVDRGAQRRVARRVGHDAEAGARGAVTSTSDPRGNVLPAKRQTPAPTAHAGRFPR